MYALYIVRRKMYVVRVCTTEYRPRHEVSIKKTHSGEL